MIQADGATRAVFDREWQAVRQGQDARVVDKREAAHRRAQLLDMLLVRTALHKVKQRERR